MKIQSEVSFVDVKMGLKLLMIIASISTSVKKAKPVRKIHFVRTLSEVLPVLANRDTSASDAWTLMSVWQTELTAIKTPNVRIELVATTVTVISATMGMVKFVIEASVTISYVR